MEASDYTPTIKLENHTPDIEILDWCLMGASLTSRGEGASLALVGCPSSDSVTIKKVL